MKPTRAYIPVISIMCLLLFYAGESMLYAEELGAKFSRDYVHDGIDAQRAGEIEQAISFYKKAILTDPLNKKAHNNLGTAYAQQGKIALAEESYHKAISIDPAYTVALQNLAIIYAERKDYERFFYYWKRATGLDAYAPFITDETDE